MPSHIYKPKAIKGPMKGIRLSRGTRKNIKAPLKYKFPRHQIQLMQKAPQLNFFATISGTTLSLPCPELFII